MIDHVGIRVADVKKSKAFYEAALGPLGYGVVMEVTPEQTGGQHGVGFGSPGKPSFWIGDLASRGPAHVAFTAKDAAAVDAFHAAALAAGGTDNGLPR